MKYINIYRPTNRGEWIELYELCMSLLLCYWGWFNYTCVCLHHIACIYIYMNTHFYMNSHLCTYCMHYIFNLYISYILSSAFFGFKFCYICWQSALHFHRLYKTLQSDTYIVFVYRYIVNTGLGKWYINAPMKFDTVCKQTNLPGHHFFLL